MHLELLRDKCHSLWKNEGSHAVKTLSTLLALGTVGVFGESENGTAGGGAQLLLQERRVDSR